MLSKVAQPIRKTPNLPNPPQKEGRSSPSKTISTSTSKYEMNDDNKFEESQNYIIEKSLDEPTQSIINRRQTDQTIGKPLQRKRSRSQKIELTCIEQDAQMNKKIAERRKLEQRVKPQSNPTDSDMAIVWTQSTARQKMLQKAQKFMNGTYKQPRNPTSQDLMNKAIQLRKWAQNIKRPKTSIPGSTSMYKVPQDSEQNMKYPPLPHLHCKKQSESRSVNLITDVDSWDKINRETVLEDLRRNAIAKKQYSTDQIIKYYLQLDTSEERRSITVQLKQIDMGCLNTIMGCFGLSQKSNEELRLQLLSLTNIQMRADEDNYILEIFWKTLRMERFKKFGKHWEDVGFTGRDPTTDMRSTGVLFLFTIFFFIERHTEYFKHIYASNSAQFAQIFIKITSTYAHLLKHDVLKGTSLKEYVDWYCAISYYIFQNLTKKISHAAQLGSGLTKLLNSINKNHKKIMRSYKVILKS